jgi:hypothetical protein
VSAGFLASLTCTFILRLPPQYSVCTQEFRVLRPLRSALDGRRRVTGARRCGALRLPSHARVASVRLSRRPRPRSARKRKSAAECACQRAQGLHGGELGGSSAFGLVAVATPARLEVTPGDGSAVRKCPWVTVKSDRCAYAYRRSSVGGTALGQGGAPAYEASAQAFWTVRFELNGAPDRRGEVGAAWSVDDLRGGGRRGPDHRDRDGLRPDLRE